MSRPCSYLVLPDVHTPFHSKPLWNKVCKLARNERFDGLVLAGDFLDLYTISSYNDGSLLKLKDWELGDEYKAGYDALKQLIDSVGPRCAERHYLYGNHEQRFLTYKAKGDNAKTGSALLSPEQGLRLREHGFRVYTNWQEDTVALGTHLEVAHGNYCPVHHAKKHLDEFEGSVAYGHTHRHQVFTTGKRGAYGLGGLFDIDSPGFHYMPKSQRRKWMNSFGVFHILDSGDFIPQPVQCWNQQFYFNGRLY